MLRVGLDFETYYDRDCSLSKLPVEEYLTHPSFHVLGCAVMVAQSRATLSNAVWLKAGQLDAALAQIPWAEVELVGHNLQFDGAILAWRYGHKPHTYLDTMALAQRFITPYTGRASLKVAADYLQLPAKGTTLQKMSGVSRNHLDHNQLLEDELAQYAMHDLWLSWQIADKYELTWIEKILQSWAVRNSLEPRLDLDLPLLRQHLWETQQARDDAVRFAAEARLAFASNLELTRTERFIRHAQCTGGQLMVSLRYWAAHTGRFGGANRMNLQNLGRKSKLRQAIKAKPGRRIVAVDASQIEARLVAWVAGCWPLLATFRLGDDPYCEFGKGLYGRPITKEDKVERQVSKVAVLQLGYGSGAAKLKFKLDTSGVPTDEERAHEIVDHYRRYAYPEIPRAWMYLESAMRAAISDGVAHFYTFVASETDANGSAVITFGGGRIELPNGAELEYDQLHIDNDDQIVYWSHRYSSWQKLYGGAIMENICQAMARELIAQVHALRHSSVVLQVHDELVQEVAEDEAEQCLQDTIALMSATPDWAQGLPLAAEGWIGTEYVKP